MDPSSCPFYRALVIGLWIVLLPACSREKSAGPCDGITCSGHGTCAVTAGVAVCTCEPGFDPDGLACVAPTAPTTDQLVQHGVVFTFDGQHRFGRWANGDFWVVGPLTVTRIMPDAESGHHGWEVSPSDVTRQGFDARAASFDATLTPELPYVAQPGDALVKAVSLAPLNDSDCRPCLQTAVVLTVVDAPPPDEGATVFRPPYFGPERTLYSTTALRPDLLPALDPVPEAPGHAAIAEAFSRVQLDHQNGWSGAAIHPLENLPEYGSQVAVHTAEGALQLLLGPDGPDRDAAIIAYVQAGIDLYHMALGGQTWPANGGHAEGRKLPIAVAALLLEDAAMAALVTTAGRQVFGENGGVVRSAEGDEVLFGQLDNSEEDYWRNLVFDTGSRTIIDPYGFIDGGHEPGGSYQFCCTAMAWKATAAAVRLLPGLEELWNHPDFLAYVDRWVARGAHAQPDPCAPPAGVCVGGDAAGADCTLASGPAVCTGEGTCDVTGDWEAGYGVTFGPDGQGGCIPDQDPADGTGRFPLLHGVSADDGYHGSALGNAMWSTYVE